MFSELKDAIDKCNTDIAYCYSTDIYKNQCINQSANSGKKIVLKSYEYNWLERTAHFTVWGCLFRYCLLYTSDAADDTPCVDLGGRRIIKKKKIF